MTMNAPPRDPLYEEFLQNFRTPKPGCTLQCPKCLGKGAIGQRGEPTAHLSGSKSHDCPLCRGPGAVDKGYKECVRCEGRGATQHGDAFRNCEDCRGPGWVPDPNVKLPPFHPDMQMPEHYRLLIESNQRRQQQQQQRMHPSQVATGLPWPPQPLQQQTFQMSPQPSQQQNFQLPSPQMQQQQQSFQHMPPFAQPVPLHGQAPHAMGDPGIPLSQMTYEQKLVLLRQLQEEKARLEREMRVN